jgi:transposase-like protein
MAAIGRPTKYKKELCDEVVRISQTGASLLECALEMGVCKQTLFNWADEHSEFLDALTRAKAARQVWWERVHRGNAVSGEGNAALVMFGLKNIAPDDYKDKQQLEHEGAVSLTVLTGVPERDTDGSESN